MGIPLPGRGYWAKKKAGTEPPRPPLPALPKGVVPTIVIADIWARRAGVPLVAPKEIKAAKPTPRITVPDTLRRPHPLVKQTLDLMKGRGPRDDFIYVGAETCLDVFVSRGSRGRALRILDALLKAREAQDHVLDIIPPKKVTSYWGEERIQPTVTRVKVGEEWIHFGLSEGRTWVKVNRPLEWAAAWGGYSIDQVRKPTGRFSLFITNGPSGFRASWNDGKKQRVEDCLTDFVAYLPLVAEKLKKCREACELRAAVERERARIREEAEEYWQEEERRRKELLVRLERWRLARDIRDYVSDLRVCGPVDEDLRWALAYADSVDPSREHGGVEADEVDKRADDEEEDDDW